MNGDRRRLFTRAKERNQQVFEWAQEAHLGVPSVSQLDSYLQCCGTTVVIGDSPERQVSAAIKPSACHLSTCTASKRETGQQNRRVPLIDAVKTSLAGELRACQAPL